MEIYATAEGAALALEPIDVRNNLFVAYDATGTRLCMDVVEVERPLLWGLWPTAVETVRVSATTGDAMPEDSDQLKKAMVAYWKAVDETQRDISSCSLAEMIQLFVKRWGQDGGWIR